MAGLLLDKGLQTQGRDLDDGNRESGEVLSVLADPVIDGVLSHVSSGTVRPESDEIQGSGLSSVLVSCHEAVAALERNPIHLLIESHRIFRHTMTRKVNTSVHPLIPSSPTGLRLMPASGVVGRFLTAGRVGAP